MSRCRQADPEASMIAFKGGAGEPSDMRLPGKAGGAVAVRRTLASTICWITGPTQVPRPRQLRDASTVMRFRPAHQSVINRRHDDRASCPARQNLEQALERKPRTRLPATWNGGHERWRRDAAPRGGFVGRGDFQRDVFAARFGA